MSIESQSDGETPEIAPAQVDDKVDAEVTAASHGAQSVEEPAAEKPSTSSASAEQPPQSEDVAAEASGPASTDGASTEDASTEDAASAGATSETDKADEAVAPKPVRKRGKTAADSDEDPNMDVEPLELVEEEVSAEAAEKHWYILKVQVNREGTIRDALERRVKVEGLEAFVDEIVVPTEDIAEFTKSGKRKITKRKLYPGYIMVNMVINDDTWFAVRETPGIGDFTGSAGKPTPMDPREVERILRRDVDEDEETQVKTSIPFNIGDHVRVKEGNFQNFEGDVDKIDEAHGLITVVINIFNRATPVEIQYWQIEKV